MPELIPIDVDGRNTYKNGSIWFEEDLCQFCHRLSDCMTMSVYAITNPSISICLDCLGDALLEVKDQLWD